MATEAIVPAAPAAAPSSAPASAPASSAPASAPVSTPESTPTFAGSGKPTTSVDASKFPIREDYARELLKEKLSAIPQENAETVAVADPATEETPAVEPAKVEPEAEVKPAEVAEEKPAEVAEEEFQLEPETIVTPEVLSQLTKDNPEFAKLLEADGKLKGQLYKTAREAAELQPYKEIFPDLDSAKTAQQGYATFSDVREAFMGSTTREGAVATLGKIAELCYERGEDGQVVMENGQPKIGEDFYGFFDNVAAMDLDNRITDVDARLNANRYASQEQRDSDERLKAALDIVKNESEFKQSVEEPEDIKQKRAELDAREQKLKKQELGEKVEDRKKFESGLQTEAISRIDKSINGILTSVEKQGGVISPYLKDVLPKTIGSAVVRKIQQNPTLQAQMQELQRLPISDTSRQRRIAAIDRAVQQYLPDIAREELRKAGVQVRAAAAAKQAQVAAQVDKTKQLEPKGSTGPATSSGAVGADKAWAQAETEWKQQNPGRSFGKAEKEQVINRVLALMGVGR